jgi:Cysteine-rich secretory protein family
MYRTRFLIVGMISSLILSIGPNKVSSQTLAQKIAQAYECNQQEILNVPNCAGDEIEPEEAKLYQLINQYRAQNGLPPIPLSKALTLVANRHVRDMDKNSDSYQDCQSKCCVHSWSNCAYNPNNSNTFPCMWQAPQRFKTGYPGNGYENLFGGAGNYIVTAESALQGWQSSSPHNAVILNQGVWKQPWQALGIGIYKGAAALWFGNEPDFGENRRNSNIPPQTETQNPPPNNSNIPPQTQNQNPFQSQRQPVEPEPPTPNDSEPKLEPYSPPETVKKPKKKIMKKIMKKPVKKRPSNPNLLW